MLKYVYRTVLHMLFSASVPSPIIFALPHSSRCSCSIFSMGHFSKHSAQSDNPLPCPLEPCTSLAQNWFSLPAFPNTLPYPQDKDHTFPILAMPAVNSGSAAEQILKKSVFNKSSEQCHVGKRNTQIQKSRSVMGNSLLCETEWGDEVIWNRHFSSEVMQKVKEHTRCSTPLIIRKMQVKTTMRYHFTPSRMAWMKMAYNSKC